MSRDIGYSDVFSSNSESQLCIQAAHEALTSLGCKPSAEENGAQVNGKMGMGWAIRIIGGMIAPATWFPVKLLVSVQDSGGQREVNVQVDENFGIGTLAGIKDKMQGRCDDIGSQLSSVLKERLS